MTEPINLTQLKRALEALTGGEGYLAYDEEPDYWQVYGDNGTICKTDEGAKAQAIKQIIAASFALIDIAEAAHEDIKHSIGAGSGAQGLRARARLQAALTKVTP